MSDKFRISIAQANPTVGDIDGNAAQALRYWQMAKDAGADMLALPEMFITGYNTQDLIIKPAFYQAATARLHSLAAEVADGPSVGIGGPHWEDGKLYNAYHILSGGRIASTTMKHELPNTTVFDEVRLFSAGPMAGPLVVGPARIGMPICEDTWHAEVVETMQETGAEFILAPNGSPYHRGKMDERYNEMVARVIESGLPLIYLNMVGGQDDQVFDGGSFALNRGGELALQLPLFEECLAHVDLERVNGDWVISKGDMARLPDSHEADYHTMVLGLRDYMRKSGFSKVLLGLSGGVDSAIVAVIAADAIGAQNVRCVMLPSEYTSQASLDDAQALAENLGCRYDYVPITEGRNAVTNTLAPLFDGLAPDLTEENIQSRLRGLLLMAMSNKFGEMLLTTGNKSEVAVGYATIYGDMAGGYNPIKDLYKTRVFEICRWRNESHRDWMMGASGAVIPENIITKAPSAELRPDQKDSDSLPDYPILDGILEMLVDRDASVADCVAAGYNKADVMRVQSLIYTSEYKRFQSAPGVRLTSRAFWLDRRYPIVNRWRDQG